MRYNVAIHPSALAPVQISGFAVVTAETLSQLPINLGRGSGQPRFNLGETASN
ncbi:MAG: hypothetical protein ACXWKG_17635 [Limisphaerales bacterium]